MPEEETSPGLYPAVKAAEEAAKAEAETALRCDPDDIVCQQKTLEHMKNLRSAFDDKTFRAKYPSLVETQPVLDESIKREEEDLKQRMATCNLPYEEPEKEKEEEHGA